VFSEAYGAQTMTDRPLHIAAFAGSLRTGSLNRKALRIAAALAAERGADVREIDLQAFNLPVFNEDLREHGFPDAVVSLKREIESADMLLIATPEYNHSIPGPLKNAVDWASDKTNPFQGKTAAIFGVSTGLVGTLRAQSHLREILGSLGVLMVPQPQVFIRSGSGAFQPDGTFVNGKLRDQLKLLVEETMDLTAAMKNSGMAL
jgi:chromate reductase, NAD(P)H dehydrogenase (quinone)